MGRTVVGKPPDGLELRCENFERVESGEVFAHGDEGILRADRPFYPVLASETGYDGMYGSTAVREGDSPERRSGAGRTLPADPPDGRREIPGAGRQSSRSAASFETSPSAFCVGSVTTSSAERSYERPSTP